MKYLVALGLMVGIAGFGVASSDEAQPLFTCETTEQVQRANECRRQCRATNDAKSKSCDDTYKQCAGGCSGDTFQSCRDACRGTYDRCRAPLRGELDACANACVTNTPGCSL